MRLASLSGRPVVHGIWGRIAGWIYDVWLDFRNARVAAFEICERDWMQSKCVEPFALQRSVRYGFGIDADPDKWELVERDVHWASVRNIQDVTVVSADGDPRSRATATRFHRRVPPGKTNACHMRLLQ
jgi:sporulation protein YlmC with PRC-barrel domain